MKLIELIEIVIFITLGLVIIILFDALPEGMLGMIIVGTIVLYYCLNKILDEDL